jgi:transposase
MDRDGVVTEPEVGPASSRTSALKSGRSASIELITRAEPRRRWSVEQKQSIAAESLAPGASPTEVARRYGISSGMLYTWRKALLAAQPGIARFARVDVAGDAKPAGPAINAPAELSAPVPLPTSGMVEIILPNRTTIRVDAQIDPRALRRVLSVLAKP